MSKKLKNTVIGIFDVYDTPDKRTRVDFKINGKPVLVFYDAHLSFHPMDESLTVISNDNRVLAHFDETFNGGFADNKWDFDFETNYEF